MVNQIVSSRLGLGLLFFCLTVASCGGPLAVTPSASVSGTSPPPVAAPAENTPIPPTNAVQLLTTTAISPQPSSADFASFADSFLATLEKQQNFSGGALIVRNGETILNKSYGFADREQKIVNSPQTKFRIGSITKQFTALAILLLQAQDRLNVQDSICAQLSDCPAAWQPITIHHLLTHTSGIPEYVAMSDFDRLKATPTTPLEIIARFKDEPLDFQPGERWGYSSSGYVLLSQIIEQVSGSSYEDFIQEYILTPLGMNDTGFEQNPDNLAVGYRGRTTTKADLIDISNAYANGSLSSTAEDLYRWGQALYSGQLVQQELLELMFAKHVEISPGEYYGYGTVVWELSGHRVLDVGGLIDGFSTSFFHFPDDKVSMILLSNQEDVDTFNLNSELAKELFGITE